MGDYMFIDLNKITDKGIIIDTTVSFDESYLKNTTIKKLDNVKVKGRIYYSITDEVIMDAKVGGVMILIDACTLEDIDYPFTINLQEILVENTQSDEKLSTNSQNTLDIMNVLWQNIVLEVPIRLTKGTFDNIPTKGEGWELVNNSEKKIDPRLAKLQELLDTRKE